MSASEISLTDTFVPIDGGVRDIYGISIPEDMCEDAMETFSSSVNAFMERKFEVHNIYTNCCRHKITSVTGAQQREQVVWEHVYNVVENGEWEQISISRAFGDSFH